MKTQLRPDGTKENLQITPVSIYIIRHGEKPDSPDEVNLRYCLRL